MNRGYDAAPAPVGNPLEPAPPGTAELRVGDQVSSAHNPASRGTVVAMFGTATARVQWDGYNRSESWLTSALRKVTDD